MMWLLACAEPRATLPVPAPALAPAPAPVAAPALEPEPAAPEFSGTVESIPADMRAAMTGVTWREGCPVGLDDLRLLRLSHWRLDGGVGEGELIVAAAHAEALVGVFAALFAAEFAIRKMRPAYHYGGSDDASMADDNTSAFNCRASTGSSSFSQHSYGHAVDINTIENPYVRGQKILPPEGAAFQNRTDVRPGMIVAGGPVVEAFALIGWKWGGSWRSLKDYQHFSANGR